MPDVFGDYSDYKGQAVELPALLELIELQNIGFTMPMLWHVLIWMGDYGLLQDHDRVSPADGSAPCAPSKVAPPISESEIALSAAGFFRWRKDRDAKAKQAAQEAELDRRLNAAIARLEELDAQLLAPGNETECAPLDPGGCPAAQELADGTPASEGASCESGQDVEGGGVIPSPSPAPDAAEDDDDGAWPIEDETDPAAPPPPCAADEEGASVATEAAPAPAEVAPEAAPAGERVGERWTPEEDRLALELRNAGMPVTAIAARLGRPYWATQGRFKKLAKNTSGPAVAAQKPAELVAQAQGPEAAVKSPAAEAEVVKTAPEGGPDGRAASKPAPVAGGAAPLPGWWADTLTFYRSIGSKGGWTPARDLVLVDGRLKELPWAVIADDLGCEGRDARARFIALTPSGESPKQLEQLAEVLKFLAADHGV